jgi:hypothetical protein
MSLTKIAGISSGSVYRSSDPDPYQNDRSATLVPSYCVTVDFQFIMPILQPVEDEIAGNVLSGINVLLIVMHSND